MSRVEVTKIIKKEKQTLVRYAKPQHPDIDSLRQSDDLRDQFVCEIHDAFKKCWKSNFIDMETNKPDFKKKEFFNTNVRMVFDKIDQGELERDGKIEYDNDHRAKAIEVYANFVLSQAIDIENIFTPTLGSQKYFSIEFQEYFKNYIMSLRTAYDHLITNNKQHRKIYQEYDIDILSQKNRQRHNHMKSNTDNKDFISIHAIQHMKNYYVRRIIADWIDNDPKPLDDEYMIYHLSRKNVWECFLMECGIDYDTQTKTFNLTRIVHDQEKNEYILHSHAFSFPKKYAKNARILAAFDKNVYHFKKHFQQALQSGGFEKAKTWLNETRPIDTDEIDSTNKSKHQQSGFITTIGKQNMISNNPFLVVLE